MFFHISALAIAEYAGGRFLCPVGKSNGDRNREYRSDLTRSMEGQCNGENLRGDAVYSMRSY
jgi:hypothetical protein